MEPIDKDGKDKFILTGNSGEVYYNSSTDSSSAGAGRQSALGDYQCKKCYTKKPFEQVRWSPEEKLFVCLDCLSQEEAQDQ